MKFIPTRLAVTAFVTLLVVSSFGHAAVLDPVNIEAVVTSAIRLVMSKNKIPGMTIGLVVRGQPHVFYYGLASIQTRQPVTRDTLFELGSVSKTFTATLATYAQAEGRLSLSDQTSTHLESLKGTAFGAVNLFQLGTHTPGGLPLQVPEDISDNDQLLNYLAKWKPSYAQGTYRTYANPGIGVLGMITAKSMGEDFTTLVEQRLFPAFGMKHSYINVPPAMQPYYAQGYTRTGAPIRMEGGVLSAEAYGIKSTATDMVRFVQANMRLLELEPKLARAVTETHTGYFKAGPMTQDLIWEQFPYPVTLKTLLAGSTQEMIFEPTRVTALIPPQLPQKNVWINKTGGTNGFGAYVAFVPAQQLGIVILANKNYPNEQKIRLAYNILKALTVAKP